MFKFAVIGHPIHHSMSPLLHRTLFELTGLEGCYEAVDVAPDNLDSWLSEAAQSGVMGFNATIPHKVGLLSACDRVSDEARLIGAVNTVKAHAPTGAVEWHGLNTDHTGFISALSPAQQTKLKETAMVMIGSGGSSRAVALALLDLRPAQLTIAVRNLDRAQATMEKIYAMDDARYQGRTPILAIPLDQLDSTILPPSALVVNTTPSGMTPDTEAMAVSNGFVERLPKNCLVYDLIYNPAETRLLRTARNAGLQTLNGLPMLVGQGIAAFEHWTGASITAEQRQICLERLQAAYTP
ncbi:MAG: shikimate dehydrogenase [Cyanobacteria bacterium HKST-UBA04]|nr:shikimate dehydrogenase [Cyanobacteria bacterium HKST-UBA04]MCA9842265.1 shikimate dehydrogenase [Cyanobacteria bacterium HKST-UBA03]